MPELHHISRWGNAFADLMVFDSSVQQTMHGDLYSVADLKWPISIATV